MANPQYPYNQPGPSSYYQHPQPHFAPPNGHYGYPNPAAAPYNPYLQYPMTPVDGGPGGLHPPASPRMHPPTSPRMQHAQASPRMHAQPSPRMNGGGRGGYAPRGGVGGYPTGYAPQHHVPMQHQHYLPPHAQYAAHAQKFAPPPPVPYSPMHYPVLPDGTYAAPAPWMPQQQQQQQTLSPLPKQLSMLPSVGGNPYAQAPSPHPYSQLRREDSGYEHHHQQPMYTTSHASGTPRYDSPQLPSSQPLSLQPQMQAYSQTATQAEPVHHSPAVQAPDPPPSPPPPAPEEETSEPEPPRTPDSAAVPLETKDDIPEAATPPAAETEASSLESAPSPSSDAPIALRVPPTFTSEGLPSSFPTEESATLSDNVDAVGGWAVWSRRPTDPTLAPGLVFSTRARVRTELVRAAIGGAVADRTPPGSPTLRRAVLAATVGAPGALQGGGGAADDIDEHVETVTEASYQAQPSEAATDVTERSYAPDTPTPRSPVSSQTSLSVSPAAVTASSASADKPVPVPEPSALSAPANKVDATPELVPAQTVPVRVAEQPAPPTAAPAVAVAKPMTKSWASLLRTEGAGSSKSTLPTSSVVGFSIPAGLVPGTGAVTPSDTTLPVVPGARPELLALLTRDPAGTAGWAPRIRPRGLVNSGNMCFANAVLQTLVYCPPFSRLFGELGRKLLGPVVGKEKEKRTPLVDATVQFLREFDVKEGRKEGKGKEREQADDDEWGVDSFMPTYVYDAMKENKRFESMRGGHQEDAEEFLGFYLDTLEEELLTILNALTPAAPKVVEQPPAQQEVGWMEVGKRNRTTVTRNAKSTESPITRIFGGKFRSTLRAPHQKDSVMVEDWRALQLDIQPESVVTIKDALAHLSHPQQVQITSPTRAGQTVDASQTVLIDALPPILVLHLKRFLYDTNVKDVVKIGKKVAFEPELEIGTGIMAASTKGIARPAKYKLFGVLYHHGQSASGGHYTLDVLHPNRDLSTHPREAWIRIDDELVSDVRPDDVFGGLERDDRCAYLLFYRRVSGGRT